MLLVKKGGVAMNPPPAIYLEQTTTLIADALKRVGKDERGGLVWVATTAGINLALASKVGDHVEVTAYIGKVWGEPLEAGIAGRVRW